MNNKKVIIIPKSSSFQLSQKWLSNNTPEFNSIGSYKKCWKLVHVQTGK
jgi:hypothetical protein